MKYRDLKKARSKEKQEMKYIKLGKPPNIISGETLSTKKMLLDKTNLSSSIY